MVAKLPGVLCDVIYIYTHIYNFNSQFRAESGPNMKQRKYVTTKWNGYQQN